MLYTTKNFICCSISVVTAQQETRTVRPIRSDLNLIPNIKLNLTTSCTLPEYILNSTSKLHENNYFSKENLPKIDLKLPLNRPKNCLKAS